MPDQANDQPPAIRLSAPAGPTQPTGGNVGVYIDAENASWLKPPAFEALLARAASLGTVTARRACANWLKVGARQAEQYWPAQAHD